MVPPRQQNLFTTFSASLPVVMTGLLGACVGQVDADSQSITVSGSGEVIDDTLCIFLGVGNKGTVVSVEEVTQ